MAGKKKTFEESLLRLEEIVNALERGDAPLEQTMSLFEEGTKLVASCKKQLDQAEQKVTRLSRGEDGTPVSQPLEGMD